MLRSKLAPVSPSWQCQDFAYGMRMPYAWRAHGRQCFTTPVSNHLRFNLSAAYDNVHVVLPLHLEAPLQDTTAIGLRLRALSHCSL